MKRKLYFKTILSGIIMLFLLTIAVEAALGKDPDFFDNMVTSVILAAVWSIIYIESQSDDLKSIGIGSFDEISPHREQQEIIATKINPEDIIIRIQKHASDRKFEIERFEDQITLFTSRRKLLMGEKIVVKRILPHVEPESLSFYSISSRKNV